MPLTCDVQYIGDYGMNLNFTFKKHQKMSNFEFFQTFSKDRWRVLTWAFPSINKVLIHILEVIFKMKSKS